MPKTRILVRRDLTQCVTLLRRGQTYLVRSGGRYMHGYPDLYDNFSALVAFTERLIELVEKLRKQI